MKKVMLKNFIPNLLHFLHFSEKAVTPHIEIIPTILRRARQPAYYVLFFEDERTLAEFGQLVSRGQTRRSRADYNELSILSSLAPSKAPLGLA
jgi:hypothetical protein